MRQTIRVSIIVVFVASTLVVFFRCAWVDRMAQARARASDDLAMYCARHDLVLPISWPAVSGWLMSEGYAGYGDGTAWLQETMELPWGQSLDLLHPTSVVIKVRGGHASGDEEALNTLFRRRLLHYRPAVSTNRCLWLDGVN
jgi:hypothetical protein